MTTDTRKDIDMAGKKVKSKTKKKPPAKKRGTRAKASKRIEMPTTDHEGIQVPCLLPVHLMKLEFLFEKIKRLSTEVELAQLKAKKTEDDAKLRVRGFQITAQRLTEERDRARGESKMYGKELSQIYGVDFKTITYDSTTGILNLPEPKKPEKKAKDKVDNAAEEPKGGGKDVPKPEAPKEPKEK